MSITDVLFSFNGRINRAKYWLGSAILVVVILIAIVVMVPFSGIDLRNPESLKGNGEHFLVPFGVLALWPSLALMTKRLHDLNKSGWWVLVAFVPYLGYLWALIYLGCVKGSAGTNDYGEDLLQQIG